MKVSSEEDKEESQKVEKADQGCQQQKYHNQLSYFQP